MTLCHDYKVFMNVNGFLVEDILNKFSVKHSSFCTILLKTLKATEDLQHMIRKFV